jgi:hypothetical protein
MQVYAPLVNVVGVVGVGDEMVDSIRLNAAQPLWATLIMLGTPLCIELIDPQFSPGLMNIFWTIDDVHVMVTVNTSRRNPVIQTNVVQLWADSSAVNCWTEENLLPWPGSAKFLFHG